MYVIYLSINFQDSSYPTYQAKRQVPVQQYGGGAAAAAQSYQPRPQTFSTDSVFAVSFFI